MNNQTSDLITETIVLKNERIGKLIVELEETRKLLARVRGSLPLTDYPTVNRRLRSIEETVRECSH